jgi:hypothetical protein
LNLFGKLRAGDFRWLVTVYRPIDHEVGHESI